MSIDIHAARQTLQARLSREFDKRERRRKQALQAARSAVPQIAGNYPAVKYIYLFASILVAGGFYKESDIDLAVDGVGPEDYFALWHDLEDALPDWNIDLRDLPPGTKFSERVKERGEKVYG